MPEGQSIVERTHATPLVKEVQAVFDRRAEHGERRLILDTYLEKFDSLLKTMPKEQRDTAMVKIQRFIVKIGGYVSEYTARFADFIRNVVVWPMIAATEDFPKDKNYQIELARANAWGEFARNTTKTATAERTAYRDHFLPTAIIGSEAVGALGIFAGATYGGAKLGGLSGAAVGGVAGAAAGAVVGGILGGSAALVMRLKDRILGPPVVYYSMFIYGSSQSAGASVGSDIGDLMSSVGGGA